MTSIPKRSISDSPDAAGAANIEHNLPSGAKKVLPLTGYLEYISSDTNQHQIEPGTLIAFYNNASTAGFVEMALAGVTIASAPAAPGANVMHLKPNDYTIISLGPNGSYRTSANVTAYRLIDASFLSPQG